MATFYKKTEDGEFVEADADVDELFSQKSDKIVSSRLRSVRERETANLRQELEPQIRAEVEAAVADKVRAEVEASYKDKLAESDARATKLDIALRRKTIAAEYGFKVEAEQFLGDGDDDDMRAKADALRAGFSTTESTTKLEKSQGSGVSKLQQSTGIRVEI